jgi:hypothetical protein
MIKVGVDRTLYELTITKSGREAFLVSYYCDTGLVLKEWLFPKSKSFNQWWSSRSSVPIPTSARVAVDLACVGKVRPTAFAEYEQDGRWPNVKKTIVGEYPPCVAKFLQDVLDTFGEFEVKKVIL